MALSYWNDLRFASRALKRRPWFTISALVVLAVGLGANVAVFTAVKATMFEPLPYADAERLALLDLTVSFRSRPGPQRARLWSYPEYSILSETPNRLADPASAYAVFSFNVATGDGAVLSSGEVVTHEYDDLLGLRPALGRSFNLGDAAADASPVMMISHDVWLDRFGADSSVVGRSMTVNGNPATMVGVAPVGFSGLSGTAEMWVPIRTAEQLLDRQIEGNHRAHWFNVVGKLREGVTLEAMQAQMGAVSAAMVAAFPEAGDDAIHGGSARLLSDSRVSDRTRRSLLVLTAGAALVLMVTCANLAAFLLTRALERKHEAAVKLAIGGSRGRVMWSFLSESVLLSVLGCGVALWIAWVGIDLLVAAWPSRFLSSGWNLSFTDLDAMRMDAPVLLFAFGLSLLTGLVFGFLPAIRATRISIAEELGRATNRTIGRWSRADARGVVVSLGIALALTLLTGAGLMIKSLRHLQDVEHGVQADHVMIFDYSLPPWSNWAQDPGAFQDAYLEQLRRLPNVVAATVTCTPPLERHCMFSRVASAGPTDFAGGSAPIVGIQYVLEDYFATFGIDEISGRVFDRYVDATAQPAVVLSERAAAQLFPNSDPIGQTVTMTREVFVRGSSGTVIGVVDDVLYDRPEQGITPDAYLSIRQGGMGTTIAVRTVGEPAEVLDEARAALNGLDREVPISEVRTLEELRSASVADTRLLARLLTVFGGVTLVLAAAGVWGVVANRVTQQRREFGLRMALGAGSNSVIGLVLRQGIVLAVVGVALGLLTVCALSRVLGSLLFDVSPLDPLSLVGAAVILTCITVIAAYIPAHRATTIDPMEVLKTD